MSWHILKVVGLKICLSLVSHLFSLELLILICLHERNSFSILVDVDVLEAAYSLDLSKSDRSFPLSRSVLVFLGIEVVLLFVHLKYVASFC